MQKNTNQSLLPEKSSIACMPIPTYVINLVRRPERRKHILKEFLNRDEFSVHIVNAYEHANGAVGLWCTIKYILQDLVSPNDELVLICEDDHQFTEAYSKETLVNCIVKAKQENADILSGGVSWFNDAVQVTDTFFWVHKFTGAQFVIVFKKFFETLLAADFNSSDTADEKMSSLTKNIFFIYPFISTQKEFGYSDATEKNNVEARVEELFNKSSSCVQVLRDVARFYENAHCQIEKCNPEDESFENITIPVYAINLCERKERREHIEKQFKGRPEFQLTVMEACKHEIGAVGLWLSIRKIIKISIENDDDVIIICEDDHEFTEYYSKQFLLKNIFDAHAQFADCLSGGAGDFGLSVPITENRYWVNPCFSTQFIVVYKKCFRKILDEPFENDVIADILLSAIASNKMVLYPFISTQMDFGYSDVTPAHNKTKDLVKTMFANASYRLGIIKTVYLQHFKGSKSR